MKNRNVELFNFVRTDTSFGCIVIFLVILIFLSPSCGGKGRLKEARIKLEELKNEYLKRSLDEIEVFEPEDVDMTRIAMERTQVAEDMEDVKSCDYVQFSSGRWLYDFGKPNVESIPYRVTVVATYYVTYYKPIPRAKYIEYERKTGYYYEPSDDGIECREKVEIKEIYFEYNIKSKRWEEKGNKVIYSLYEEEEEE